MIESWDDVLRASEDMRLLYVRIRRALFAYKRQGMQIDVSDKDWHVLDVCQDGVVIQFTGRSTKYVIPPDDLLSAGDSVLEAEREFIASLSTRVSVWVLFPKARPFATPNECRGIVIEDE